MRYWIFKKEILDIWSVENLKTAELFKLGCVLHYDINISSWGQTKKKRLWLDSDVFVCQVDKRSTVLVGFCQHETN